MYFETGIEFLNIIYFGSCSNLCEYFFAPTPTHSSRVALSNVWPTEREVGRLSEHNRKNSFGSKVATRVTSYQFSLIPCIHSSSSKMFQI
jgi:hypothetical protein